MEALRTARLLLRPLRADDAPALSAYRSDPEVARYQSWEAPFSRAQARSSDRRAGPGTARNARRMAPVGRSSGSMTAGLVGDLGVRVFDDGRQAEVGFTIASAWQRQGYALEGVARILDSLFVTQGVRRVRADCDTRNLALPGCSSASASVARGSWRPRPGRAASGATTTSTRCSRASGSPAAASVL